KPLHATDATFLLLSALADGLMALIFLWVLLKYKKDAAPFAPEKDFPVNFSLPMTLTRYLYRSMGVLFLLTTAGIVCIRLFTDGTDGIGAVFGNPDPLIGNTTVIYSTLAIIAFLLVKREKLRPALFHTLSIPLIFGGIVSLLWVLFSTMQGGVWIHTRVGTAVQVNWYFILHALICFLLAALLIGFRRMYFKIDYAVNTLSPSAAINILALTNAFFNTDNKQQVGILRAVDRYAGGINGRKRGLLNLPFGLFENGLNFLYGLHPPFSTMSREEQRYCLKRYFLRDEREQKRSMMPGLAGFAYQIGVSLNSLVTFAYYSSLNAGHGIGYVPVDARDRTQGDTAAYPPPFEKIANLPLGPADPNNFKPVMPGKEGPVVAPRVTTPVTEPDIPAEVDYLIIGSGAGGATAAYRLACAVKDPSRILVVERGNRYQPLQDFTDNEIDMMKKIYKEGGLQQTKQFTMTMMQGECLGGTTVTNNAVCFEMPDLIKKNWQEEYDIDLSGLPDEYAKVAADLNISSLGDTGINQVVKEKFEQAVAALNNTLPPGEKLNTDYPLKVNHLNTMGDGNWNLGNKRMRKRSMLETCIPWSEARGVSFISNLTAVRFTSSGGRKADAVILRADNGGLSKVKVRKAVLLAGGVLSSSHFLVRSGLANPNTGRRISCNFAFPATFEFEDVINAFDGDQITLGALDPRGRSAFETYFNPPASFALSSIPFFFNRRDNIMNRYKYLVNFGSLIGSEPNGITRKKADLLNGQSFTWTLGKKDVANIKYGLGTLVKLGQLAGAKRAILPT
ncbi:MAG TPA: GMC family oxidoreductase N-terminal domain-containing protein, partial [Chitinophagaceae bacterium]